MQLYQSIPDSERTSAKKTCEIPRDLFTPIFAISRVAGWLAHWREQLGANRIFRPSQIYTGSAPRDWITLENRK